MDTFKCKTLNSGFNIDKYQLEWLGGERFAYFIDKNIQLLNSDGLTLKLTGHSNEISLLKWFGNDMMASGSKDGTIKVWQLDTGECLEKFLEHSNEIVALELVNENILASFARNEAVRVWNTDFRQQKQSRLKTHQNVDMSQEKSYFLFKSVGKNKLAFVYPNKIRVWDVVNDKLLIDMIYSSAEKQSNDNKDISLLRSHGENTLIGAIGSTIIVWNVETGERLHVLNQHSERITSLAELFDNSFNEFVYICI